MKQPVFKKLDELSFSDLYVEVDEQNFPHISLAFRQLVGWLRSKRPIITTPRVSTPNIDYLTAPTVKYHRS